MKYTNAVEGRSYHFQSRHVVYGSIKTNKKQNCAGLSCQLYFFSVFCECPVPSRQAASLCMWWALLYITIVYYLIYCTRRMQSFSLICPVAVDPKLGFKQNFPERKEMLLSTLEQHKKSAQRPLKKKKKVFPRHLIISVTCCKIVSLTVFSQPVISCCNNYLSKFVPP